MKAPNQILILIVCAAIILSIVTGFYILSQSKEQPDGHGVAPLTNEINFPGHPGFVVSAELAQTPDELSRGLMYRTSLPINSGMLFVFSNEALQTFWMENTKISLDLIFISAAGKIVDIKHDFLPCSAAPCETYTSSAPAKYVLEINGNIAQKEGLNSVITLF